MPIPQPSTPTTNWSAETVLELFNKEASDTFTCSGSAASKGRRCKNPIAKANQTVAIAIAEVMSSEEPREAASHTAILNILATSCLCRRYHNTEDRKKELIDRWQRIMESEQNRIDRKRRNKAGRLLLKLELMGDLRSREYDTLMELCETLRRSQRDEAENESEEENDEAEDEAENEEDEEDVEEKVEEDEEEEVEEDEEEGDDHEEDGDEEEEDQEVVEEYEGEYEVAEYEDEDEDENEDVEEDRDAEPTASNHEHDECTDDHVSRRTVDDDCPVCREAMADTPLADLVWCKASCGRSIHSECFGSWQALVVSQRRRLTCVVWYVIFKFSCLSLTKLTLFSRAVWKSPCEHDREPVPE